MWVYEGFQSPAILANISKVLTSVRYASHCQSANTALTAHLPREIHTSAVRIVLQEQCPLLGTFIHSTHETFLEINVLETKIPGLRWKLASEGTRDRHDNPISLICVEMRLKDRCHTDILGTELSLVEDAGWPAQGHAHQRGTAQRDMGMGTLWLQISNQQQHTGLRQNIISSAAFLLASVCQQEAFPQFRLLRSLFHVPGANTWWLHSLCPYLPMDPQPHGCSGSTLPSHTVALQVQTSPRLSYPSQPWALPRTQTSGSATLHFYNHSTPNRNFSSHARSQQMNNLATEVIWSNNWGGCTRTWQQRAGFGLSSAKAQHSPGAQCVPDKNLQNLDPGKNNGSAGSWSSPTACSGYQSIPCTRMAKTTAENPSLAQRSGVPQWTVHLGSLLLLFPLPPPPPFLSSLSLRLKPTNLNSPQILICSSLPAIHYLLRCLVNSKYWLL